MKSNALKLMLAVKHWLLIAKGSVSPYFSIYNGPR